MPNKSSKKALIVGGTMEARLLAEDLTARGLDITTLLAGLTRAPRTHAGTLIQNRFGSAQAFADFIEDARFSAVIDATHPFAQTMSARIASVCAGLKLPLICLERPAWAMEPDETWIMVKTVQEACERQEPGTRIFLTIGRKEAGVFFARPDLCGTARMIEPLACAVPPVWRIDLANPPFSMEQELANLCRSGASVLVAKNSGGTEGRVRLSAAKYLKMQVFMISRPEKPPIESGATPEEIAMLLTKIGLI